MRSTAATLCPLPGGDFGACVESPPWGNVCAPNMTCDDYGYLGPSGAGGLSGPFTHFDENFGNACLWLCADDLQCPPDMICGGVCLFPDGMEPTAGGLVVFDGGQE